MEGTTREWLGFADTRAASRIMANREPRGLLGALAYRTYRHHRAARRRWVWLIVVLQSAEQAGVRRECQRPQDCQGTGCKSLCASAPLRYPTAHVTLMKLSQCANCVVVS